MKNTFAAAIVTTAGFASVLGIAREKCANANQLIFGILFLTLIISLAIIGAQDRNRTDKNE